jgi:cation diffusion facilitator family transporter
MSHDHAHPHAPTPLSGPEEARRRFAAILSMVVGVGMLLGKWAAYVLTGSHAILSDALESVVHVAATAFALVSLIVAARPPDPKYPYGYGKIGYFSAGFEGGLIALAALLIFYEAAQGILAGEPLTRLDLGLALIVAASVVNLGLGLWLIAQGKRTGSLILVADGQHVLSDSYTSFGVVLGIALVKLTGWRWLDPAVAVLLGANILRTGVGLVREAYSGLMGRADPALLDRIVGALQAARQPGWLDLHHLRAWQSGDRVFVDFHLVVPADWTVTQVHDAQDFARDRLREALGPAAEPIIHFDPERPGHAARLNRPWTRDAAVLGPDGLPPDPADAPDAGLAARP